MSINKIIMCLYCISSKKNSLITLLLCFVISFSMAQNSNSATNEFWQNVRFGGGIGLSFGDRFFSGTLAPSAIYEFNNQFALGIGLNATYAKRKNLYKSSILGGSLIGLYSPINELQFSAELEELNIDRDYDQNFVSNIDDNFWYTALFIGAGYRTGNITFGIRYDVLYDEDKSIYADPWIPFVRVYF